MTYPIPQPMPYQIPHRGTIGYPEKTGHGTTATTTTTTTAPTDTPADATQQQQTPARAQRVQSAYIIFEPHVTVTALAGANMTMGSAV